MVVVIAIRPHGKVHTAQDKLNQKKMNKVLLRQMQRKAVAKEEERAAKLAEEKRFIDHMKKVRRWRRRRRRPSHAHTRTPHAFASATSRP